MKKKITITALMLGAMLGATACGGTIVGGIDKNKTQIYISVYNGGLGYAWIEKQSAAWNATNDKYQIMILPEQNSAATVVNDIAIGAMDTDVYYVGDAGARYAVEKGYLEDLSDILTKKVDGTDRTVGDKLTANMDYYNTWKTHASKSGEGLYMLPYGDAVAGLVFDYDAFVENNWLTKVKASDEVAKSALTTQGITYETAGADLVFKSYTGSGRVNYVDGDYILSAGKDGKYGTYDDGQPQTIAEFGQMVNRIVSIGNNKAFIWTGSFSGYTHDVAAAIMAQYSGVDALTAYYTFDSKGKELTMYDGSKKVITPDNGYEVYGLDGYQVAVDFMNTYFNNSRYVHSKSHSNISHTEAQNLFLLGHRGEQSNPYSAMIVEGGWWENEAVAMFDAISEKEPERGHGKRDYRYMLIPELEGQAGIDGEGNGSVLSVRSSGAILVPKCKDAAKLAAIKDFLAYTLSDENLRAFTRETSVVTPYSFELTEEDRAAMTPFANNVRDLYTDSENVAIVRPMLEYSCSPMKFATSGFHLEYFPVKSSIPHASIIKAFEAGASVDDIVKGTAQYYTKAQWTDMLTVARAAGFYQ